MDKTKWKSIMLPRQLEEQLETFSKSELANNLGFTNKSQIAAVAIRDFLRSYSNYLSYLDFLDASKTEIKIMDHNLGSVIKITINDEGELLCSKHQSDHCVHVRFISEIPRLQEIFSEKPLIAKKSRTYTEEEILELFRNKIEKSFNRKSDQISNKKLRKIIETLEEK